MDINISNSKIRPVRDGMCISYRVPTGTRREGRETFSTNILSLSGHLIVDMILLPWFSRKNPRNPVNGRKRPAQKKIK